MAGITDSVLEDIKSRIDLAELISSYGIAVKHVGSSIKACCPFHNEKTPSFNINTSKGFYHCFGCGESGDAIKFVMKYEGLDFVGAVKKLAEQCGVKIEEKSDPEAFRRKRLLALMAELAQFYHRCLGKMREAQMARDYLAKRDLGEAVQSEFLIGYAPNGVAPILKWAGKYGYTVDELEAAGVIKGPSRPGDSGYHRFGGRLVFSINDKQGRVVAFSARQLVEKKNSGKYVNSPETIIFKKSNVLFGFDRAAANIAKAPHREAIICEGQIDTIRLHICGFPVAVASQGTSFTDEHAKMLKRVADAVLLVFDDDAAGHKATIRTAAMLLAAEIPVRVVSLPDGDDPDSFLRKKGADAFRKLMENAESAIAFQCRVEQAKEHNAKSIDAVARISKAVLATVNSCPSAILRSSMLSEASRLLGLPYAALAEELGKIKQSPAPAVHHEAANTDEDQSDAPERAFADDAYLPGDDAGESAPPPKLEMALMEFLLSNEHDKTLDAMVGEFLPKKAISHDFTWRFIETWRTDVVDGSDAMSAFAQSLPARERSWFDAILVSIGRMNADGRAATDIMQEFVRNLWVDFFARCRGQLPIAGDAQADMERLRISFVLKRLKLARWHEVKDIVRQQIMKG
ncbi:MAG: DNA primase [Kiritimatiellae bacterium]|nr:DNA primase [Kiritimatiellia bacterium]